MVKDCTYYRIVGEISRLKIYGSVMENGINYTTGIIIKKLKLWDKRIEQEQILKAFSMLIMDSQKQVIGEYRCTPVQDIVLKKNEDGTIDIKGIMKCSSMLTNRVLNLWGFWEMALQKNLWDKWGKKRKKAWLSICKNHQNVRRDYYQENIENMQLEKVFLDGTGIDDRLDFSCALGEAIFGRAGYYGNSNELDGYGYLHDAVALGRSVAIYWENFKRPSDLVLAWYMELMINTSDAGAELIILPKKLTDIKQDICKKIMFLNGECIESRKDFINACSKIMEVDEGVHSRFEQLAFFIEKMKKQGTQLVIVWRGYHDSKSEENYTCLEFLIKYGVVVILTHKNVDDNDIKQVLNGKKASLRKQEKGRINVGHNKEGRYITAKVFEKIIDGAESDFNDEYVKFKIQVIEGKLWVRTKEIYRLVIALCNKYDRWPTESIIANLKILMRAIERINDETICSNDLVEHYEVIHISLFQKSAQMLEDKLLFSNRVMGVISHYILKECTSKEELIQTVKIVNGFSIDTILKFVEILIDQMESTSNKEGILLHLLTQQHPKEILSFVIEYVLRSRKRYEAPIPTIAYKENGEVISYFGLPHMLIAYLEKEGELYYNILSHKLNSNLNSPQLWYMYYRACLINKQKETKWFIKRIQGLKECESASHLRKEERKELHKITSIFAFNLDQ